MLSKSDYYDSSSLDKAVDRTSFEPMAASAVKEHFFHFANDTFWQET